MDFTANITCNNDQVVNLSSNNFQMLLIKLLSTLEAERNFSVGEIIDNHTGDILHRCRKVAYE